MKKAAKEYLKSKFEYRAGNTFQMDYDSFINFLEQFAQQQTEELRKEVERLKDDTWLRSELEGRNRMRKLYAQKHYELEQVKEARDGYKQSYNLRTTQNQQLKERVKELEEGIENGLNQVKTVIFNANMHEIDGAIQTILNARLRIFEQLLNRD